MSESSNVLCKEKNEMETLKLLFNEDDEESKLYRKDIKMNAFES